MTLENYVRELDEIALDFAAREVIHSAINNPSDTNSPLSITKSNRTDSKNSSSLVVMNMCDCFEYDGYPGIRVVKELERRGLPFTGASSQFYEITTSKILMKKLMLSNQVPTSPFVQMHLETLDEDISEAEKLIGFPMIVKLDLSSGSCGISDKSVVWSAEQARTQVKSIWHEAQGRVFIEKFLAGREFTVLVTGNESTGYPLLGICERVFHQSLDRYQKFYSFERCWDGYGLKATKPELLDEFVQYRLPPAEHFQSLASVALAAYKLMSGNSYGRVDIRTDSDDLSVAKVFVLEVNSQVFYTDSLILLVSVLHF